MAQKRLKGISKKRFTRLNRFPVFGIFFGFVGALYGLFGF